jgi:hypothetical protein
MQSIGKFASKNVSEQWSTPINLDKAVVSRNGWKGGHLVRMRVMIKAMNQVLQEQKQSLP